MTLKLDRKHSEEKVAGLSEMCVPANNGCVALRFFPT